MEPIAMRRIFSRLNWLSAAFCVAIATLPTQAIAGTIVDPVGDFLATYQGVQGGDLDVTGMTVTLNAITGVFSVRTVLNAPVGTTPGAFYVYGVNRGAGTAGFAALGLSNVLFDRVIIVRQDASVNIGATNVGTAVFTGNFIEFIINQSVVGPSTGLAPELYGWNLWPRAATNAAGQAITGNIAISDFAPNNATLAAVPEPSTWTMLLAGIGLTGWAMRCSPRKSAVV
jgi:hypothetical protein